MATPTRKNLYIDQLTDSEHHLAKIIITTPDGYPMVAYITNDFQYGGQTQWGTPWADLGSDTVQNVANVATRGGNWLSKMLGNGQTGEIAQRKLQTYAQTVEDYKGNEKQDIALSLLFVAIRGGDEIDIVRKNTARILAGLYPWGSNAGMKAPYNYATSKDKAHGGVWSVKIGTWFQASQLLLSSGSITYSQQVVGSKDAGKVNPPLYAVADVTFKPFIMLNAKQVLSQFTGLEVDINWSGKPGKGA